MLAALPATLELALVGLAARALISVPGGVLAFVLYRRTASRTAADLVVALHAVDPVLSLGLLLILGFGVCWPVLPFSGRVEPASCLPDITGFALIDLSAGGPVRRLAERVVASVAACAGAGAGLCAAGDPRAALQPDRRRQRPYVEVARLRGLSETRILWRHMLKNAALPTITMIGVQFGFLFGGALLVEMIFGFPGVGNLMVQAVEGQRPAADPGHRPDFLRADAG